MTQHQCPVCNVGAHFAATRCSNCGESLVAAPRYRKPGDGRGFVVLALLVQAFAVMMAAVGMTAGPFAAAFLLLGGIAGSAAVYHAARQWGFPAAWVPLAAVPVIGPGYYLLSLRATSCRKCPQCGSMSIIGKRGACGSCASAAMIIAASRIPAGEALIAPPANMSVVPVPASFDPPRSVAQVVSPPAPSTTPSAVIAVPAASASQMTSVPATEPVAASAQVREPAPSDASIASEIERNAHTFAVEGPEHVENTPWLAIQTGPHAGRSFRLTRPTTTVGRSKESNDIALPLDTKLSRNHAVFLSTERGWILEDRNSTNGTFLDGVRIQRSEAREGAVVKLGDSTGIITQVLSNRVPQA